MDPLSIIASIAGIATAGTALSKAIYELISSSRGAAREMADMARTIADLSIVLGELRRVLKSTAELCSRRYLRRIKSAMRRIAKIHDEIHDLLDGIQGFASITWRFKRSEVQAKLALIEGHKTGINLMLNILLLAIATREQSQPSGSQTRKDSRPKSKQIDQDPAQEVRMLRQQSETLAYTAYQMVSDLSSNSHSNNQAQSNQSTDANSSQANGPNTEIQVKTFGERSDDTAAWLFDLVFSPYAHSCMDRYASHSSEPFGNSKGSRDVSERGNDDDDEEEEDSTDRQSGAGHTAGIGDPLEMQLAIYNPGAASLLVQELLADWTILTEKEIKSMADKMDILEPKDAEKKTQDARREGKVGKEKQDAEEESQDVEKLGHQDGEAKNLDEPQETMEYIYLWDLEGRKFILPFDSVKTYKGLEELILQILKSTKLAWYVRMHGYSLLGSDGRFIEPERWSHVDFARKDIDAAQKAVAGCQRPEQKKLQILKLEGT